MDALNINSSFWGFLPFNNHKKPHKNNRPNSNSNNNNNNSNNNNNVTCPRFPLKQAVTAASLALTGDTIAQLRHKYNNNNILLSQQQDAPNVNNNNNNYKDVMRNLVSDHDWLRALRMTSYGFLLYGPGSYAWYQYLDHCMPKQNIQNLLLKVLLNQIVLGPTVIAVVFAWNNLWLGKLSELPKKYQKDALSTLLFGFRFWIPVSLLNFWVVPLQARVAFMSTGSIFWNFCLSSTMSK